MLPEGRLFLLGWGGRVGWVCEIEKGQGLTACICSFVQTEAKHTPNTHLFKPARENQVGQIIKRVGWWVG